MLVTKDVTVIYHGNSLSLKCIISTVVRQEFFGEGESDENFSWLSNWPILYIHTERAECHLTDVRFELFLFPFGRVFVIQD